MSNLVLLEEYLDDNKYEICEEKVNGEPKLFYRGVIARANFANRNKRVYPIPVMEAAVSKAQKSIQERAFVGELDHPACVGVSDFSVLGEKGWVEFLDCKVGDKVATFDENNNIIYQEILAITNEPYKGNIYHFEGRNIDVPFTGTHRLYLEDRYGKREVVTVKEIFDNRKKYNKHKIIKTGNWEAESQEEININGTIVKTKDFVQFLGIWLAEGHVSKTKNIVDISQNEGEVSAKIRELLSRMPLKFSEYKREGRDNILNRFVIREDWLTDYLRPIGGCYEKYIPYEIKQLDASCLEELIEWFILGDGRDYRGLYGGNRVNIFSVSKKLIEDLHELVIKCGSSGNWTEHNTIEDYMFADHLIEAENKSTLYQLNISTTKGIYLDERFLKIEEKSFDGNVYCITVPNGNFYMKYKGKAYLTGNSPKINVEKISHIISSMKLLESGEVVGEIEPLDTNPGQHLKTLMKSRIKLGVSTRGSGTVKPYAGPLGEGLVEVNPDFNMAAVDIVWNPSNDAYPQIVTESTNIMLGQTEKFKQVWQELFGK
jgi:uncharacterized protein YheU (UPF0270 family)